MNLGDMGFDSKHFNEIMNKASSEGLIMKTLHNCRFNIKCEFGFETAVSTKGKEEVTEIASRSAIAVRMPTRNDGENWEQHFLEVFGGFLDLNPSHLIGFNDCYVTYMLWDDTCFNRCNTQTA